MQLPGGPLEEDRPSQKEHGRKERCSAKENTVKKITVKKITVKKYRANGPNIIEELGTYR